MEYLFIIFLKNKGIKMEPTYTLWHDDILVKTNMTEDEFIDELLDLQVDFGYLTEEDRYIIYNNHYWYEIDSAGIL